MSFISNENKQKVMDTALTLFQEKGVEEVSVREICEAAGVPRSSFYTIFSGKEDILAAQVENVKMDFESMMPAFLQASSDFERIWFLTDAYIKLAVQFGPNMTKAALKMELEGRLNFLGFIESFNDWLITLIGNCQKNGIIGNPSDPADLLRIQLDLSKGVLLDWARNDGSYDIEDRIRQSFYRLLLVPEEYQLS
ncbi:MAG: TetR/AcrR family transcriptional regulator [Clostridia bacterium]|nr:TetR/AcrR family transcriptional regulator [Clostridia bacterium]